MDKFDSFYTEIYGSRWPLLKESLLKESTPIEFSANLEKSYYLDEASYFAATQLPINKGDEVLDMCSAPGGKALVLATKLQGEGLLVCNDRSSARRARLINVVNQHLKEKERTIVEITPHDATKWGLYEKEKYDAILLDAPCSSERHVIQNEKALKQWSKARTKQLAVRQFAMLAAAFDAVKIGGYILYCTCTISPIENEQVIEKLNKKRLNKWEEVPTTIHPYSEKLKYGSIILPDKANNMGPLYYCLIRRVG
jgi:16S rRNA C967 or C1407 C5-methylase (RsmB/RsmF family)